MRQKITINDLRRWKANPPEKQCYVSDADSCLKVRRNKDGSVAFCVRPRRKGKRTWKTLGQWPDHGLADARQWAREWKAGVQVSTPKEVLEEIVTWGELAEQYIEGIKGTAKRWDRQEYYLRKYVPKRWHGRPADSITKAEVRALIRSIGERGPYTANRVQKTLAAAFNSGVEAELIDRHPMRGMKRMFKEKARKNIQDFEQLRRIWDACEELADFSPNARAIQLILLTGQRPTEIRTARYDRIKARWLGIPDNKPERFHQVYLSDLAWKIIEGLPSRGVSPYLFPGARLDRPTTALSNVKYPAEELADVGSWQLRDLRSTLLTQVIAHCGALPIHAKVMANHRIPGITDDNYIERMVYYPKCQEIWQAWGQLIEKVVAGEAAEIVPFHQSLELPWAHSTSTERAHL